MARPRKMDSDLSHGRHGVFALHVHLVFVTKYRRNVFSKEHLDAVHLILASVCRDVDDALVEFNGEHDHVHLLLNYPLKVALSHHVRAYRNGNCGSSLATFILGSNTEVFYGRHPISRHRVAVHQ